MRRMNMEGMNSPSAESRRPGLNGAHIHGTMECSDCLECFKLQTVAPSIKSNQVGLCRRHGRERADEGAYVASRTLLRATTH